MNSYNNIIVSLSLLCLAVATLFNGLRITKLEDKVIRLESRIE
jgi:hypothetical protein